jgi:predicted CopG family antitoxin
VNINFRYIITVFNIKRMNTKLTLTIEQEIINKAKKFAKENNRSLSDIIENYLKFLIADKKTKKINPIVDSLKGSFKLPNEDIDYKKELNENLAKKYL